jgi:hypothetical protein
MQRRNHLNQLKRFPLQIHRFNRDLIPQKTWTPYWNRNQTVSHSRSLALEEKDFVVKRMPLAHFGSSGPGTTKANRHPGGVKSD